MSRDLRELLASTAVEPDWRPDPAELIARGRRRRQRRYASTAVAAAAVLILGGVAVLDPVSAPSVPEVADQPPGGQQREDTADEPDGSEATDDPVPDDEAAAPTPDGDDADDGDGTGTHDTAQVEEPAGVQDAGPELTLEDDGTITGLDDAAERGLLVQDGSRVVLVGLDGEAQGHLRGQLTDPQLPGLASDVHMPAIEVEGSGAVWLDPAAATWRPAVLEAPMYADVGVLHDVDQPPAERMQLLRREQPDPGTSVETLGTWAEGASWWLSSDHRVVTWLPCDDGDCVPRMVDTDMGAQDQLDEGCWVAASVGDFAHTLLCDQGRSVVSRFLADEQAVDVPDGTDGKPATATAVLGDIVRVEHATCDIVEARRLVAGERLEPLLGDPAATPSAVPLDVTYPGDDGEVLIHHNLAACGGTAEVPGVYRYDRTTGASTLVYGVAAGLDEVVAWRPGPPL